MKSILLLFFIPGFALSQISANEITRTKIVIDRVVHSGLNASLNYHVAENVIRPHQWEEVVTDTLSKKFIIPDFRKIRTCVECKRKEVVHDSTWSERVRK